MRRIWSTFVLLICSCVLPSYALAAPPPTAPGRIAFSRKDGLWLWEAGQERRLLAAGEISAPRFSADGEFIAFRRGRSPYVMRVDGQGPWALPGVDLQWAPHGHVMAVSTAAGVEIVPVSEDGPAKPTLTVRDWQGAAWSPDGRRLALVRAERSQQPMTGRSTIAVMALQEQEPRVLLQEAFYPRTTKGAWGPAGSLRWSADGAWLSFMRYCQTASCGNDLNQLAVISVRGDSPPVTVGTMPPNQSLYAWSPVNSVLAFTDGPWRSVFYNKQVRVAPMPPKAPFQSLTPEGYADREPAWHPSGQYLALSRSRAIEPHPPSGPPQEQAMWVIPLATRQGHKVQGSDLGIGPRWGRDGSLLWVLPPNAGEPASLWWRPAADDGPAREVIHAMNLTWENYGQWPWREVYDWWVPSQEGAPHRSRRSQTEDCRS